MVSFFVINSVTIVIVLWKGLYTYAIIYFIIFESPIDRITRVLHLYNGRNITLTKMCNLICMNLNLISANLLSAKSVMKTLLFKYLGKF